MASGITFSPLKDRTSISQGKQQATVIEVDGDGNENVRRIGYVMRREGERRWRGYMAGHPEVIGEGASREKALEDARRKLEGDAEPEPEVADEGE